MTAGSRLLPRQCRNGCGTPVFFALKAPPTTPEPKWLPFEAADRDPSRPEAVNSWVLVGVQAWKPSTLTEHLMVSREISEEKARELAGGYPWHRLHACPERDGGDAA